MVCENKVVDFLAESDEPHFRMIDVGGKRVTRRRAIASGQITVGEDAFKRIKDKTLPKGDVLSMAEMAGIMAAKKTPDVLPMCHTLPLDKVELHCVLSPPDAVIVYCQAVAHAKTGVEMEAIIGAQAALATIWDLTKGVEPALQISDVRLLVKEGGKSGLWIHPLGIPDWLAAQLPDEKTLSGVAVSVLVMSDRASSGEYEDKSGAVISGMLTERGADVADVVIILDDIEVIKKTLVSMQSEKPHLIVLSGGTGFGARDVTPEAMGDVCDRLIPGFGELLRKDGADITDMSWLSRSCAGLIGETLLIAMPGSPKAVKEGLDVLLPILPHALRMVVGGKHE